MFELKLSSRTVIDWFSFCREVVADYVERNSQCIGGVGKIVEIDEAMLEKRKYNRGRMLTEQWVIGGVERGVRGECKAFFEPVENHTSETLIGIIRRYVLPGTTIMTDCWRGYNSLEDYGYRHFTVNHSENFVDHQTGANTQTFERLWVEVRRHVPKAGFRREALSGYLAEVLFRRWIPCYARRRHIFWKAAATLYPPDHPLACGTDEPYISKWFAYQHFEFLKNRDVTSNTTLDIAPTRECEEATEDNNPQLTDQATDIDNPIGGVPSQYPPPASQVVPSPMNTARDDSFESSPAKRGLKRKRIGPKDDTQEMMSTALQVLKSSIRTSSDPHFTYALYLADEMRKYDPPTLASVKRAFANIIYDADMSMAKGSKNLQSEGPASFGASTSGRSTPVSEGPSPQELQFHLSSLDVKSPEVKIEIDEQMSSDVSCSDISESIVKTEPGLQTKPLPDLAASYHTK
ncbi:uncharacterized protein LOC123682436 isoform X2 [Harmonia axyridis]|uniref:uncharacterized protein LOC123682436 isoform X2 n=1 Tax=Harmonia axyridis TaxID=115357 RepID=UPI001E278B19|nr:uncharacterized protein LOC123682436 isoform X2 [Harmonia axyridis]